MIELRIPYIYKDKDYIGYGGNQEWFLDEWAQKAGCASVLASNMYAYYLGKRSIAYNDFLNIMETMYQEMIPGKMGYPFLYKFGRVFTKIMAQENQLFLPVYQKKSKSINHALSFVLDSLNDFHPVAMLILHHQAKELEDDNWHWICITGYQQTNDGYHIIFSDCGERRIIDANVLFDTSHQNVYKMVRMKKRS